MFEKLADKTRDILLMNTDIFIEGNKIMSIENCSRIEECSDVFMSIVSGRLNVRIWGNGLRAYDYRTNAVVIRGRISQIEFSERRESGHDRKNQGQN